MKKFYNYNVNSRDFKKSIFVMVLGILFLLLQFVFCFFEIPKDEILEVLGFVNFKLFMYSALLPFLFISIIYFKFEESPVKIIRNIKREYIFKFDIGMLFFMCFLYATFYTILSGIYIHLASYEKFSLSNIMVIYMKYMIYGFTYGQLFLLISSKMKTIIAYCLILGILFGTNIFIDLFVAPEKYGIDFEFIKMCLQYLVINMILLKINKYIYVNKQYIGGLN